MKKQKLQSLLVILFFIIFAIFLSISTNVYAENNATFKNTTRVYFCSEITKEYGNGDCILLENYNSEGKKIYGLIDAGRKIVKKDSNGNNSTVVKEFLKSHGVKKLEFLAITHSHGDHNGDATTVLDNFEVDKIYMKEFDIKYVSDASNQGIYENIIERAIAKNINVIGVSYLSLISSEISPSRSEEFINNTKNARPELFESFNEKNIEFNFGSSKIKLFNWEMFSEDGKQYITGVTTEKSREIVTDENNNSIGLLLTQGNKKAFFSGDMNNLDKNDETGRVGDEDRIKDSVGKIDFLKLGHHGYQNSNTEDYINVLKPEYAVITNDFGGAYKEIVNWLKKNNVDYLYSTVDEYEISTTITEDNVYLGFKTTGSLKNINDTLYYIPEGNEYEYEDYTNIVYKLEYQEKNVEASSWSELKKIIENNKSEIVKLDNNTKTCTLNKLIINLKSGGDWTADDTIEITAGEQVVLTASEGITLLRGKDLKSKPLFLSNGTLSIGTEKMKGTITLDGNKDNVESSSTLLRLENGIFNLYNNVTLCNNMNKTTQRTRSSTIQDYTSFGSAIFATSTEINMYGGNITNNSQDVVYTHTLPKKIGTFFRYTTFGTGIYLTNNSVLNMKGGSICNNEAENHSIVKTDSSYTNAKTDRGITQTCNGVGIYAQSNSEVNLIGGSIKENYANNNSSILLTTATEQDKHTNVKSTNNGIYGVGVSVYSSKLTITNNFEIKNNNADLNSKINLEKDTKINDGATSAVRGLQAYSYNSEIIIDGANIIGGKYANNTEVSNNGKIGTSGTGSVSKTDLGGGLLLTGNSTYSINNLNISKCRAIQGGGIFINSTSNGTITNTNISNNEAQIGGGIFLSTSNGTIANSNMSNNEAEVGGGIYVANNLSNLKLNNVKITNNSATKASGGGIYAFGNLTIEGNDTIISNNTANTYGGGIMVKTKCIMEDGLISGNTAKINAGGGVRVDGDFILNEGTITGNSAKTTGGGVDYSVGIFRFNSGKIENNTAEQEGNETYPDSTNNVDWTKDGSLNLQKIDMNLIKSFNRGEDISTGGLQGMTMTDKYIIFAQITSNDDNTVLNIVDKNTFELLNTIDDYCFKHANDMAYNHKTGEICILTSSKNIAKFKINDSYELVDLSYVECERGYSGITYDENDDYYIGYAGKKMYIMNSDFKEIYNFETPTNLVTQGITYWKHHIYFSCYEAGSPNQYQTIFNNKEKFSNLIYVYDMKGNLERTLYIPNTAFKGEIESPTFYENGEMLIDYNITLNDKKTVSFYKSEIFKIESTTYNIDKTEKVITNVPHNTNLANFKKNIETTGLTYKIVNKQNQEIKETELITTGSKIITNTDEEYQIIVTGDANYDGKVGIADISIMANQYTSANSILQDIQKMALDFNNNKKIDIGDLSRIVNIYTDN